MGAQWATATAQVNKVALDPDAKRLVRDTMASGFRSPDRAVRDREGLSFSGARALVVHHKRGADVRDVDARARRRTARHDRVDRSGCGAAASSPPRRRAPQLAAPEVVETGHIGLDHRTRRGDSDARLVSRPVRSLPDQARLSAGRPAAAARARRRSAPHASSPMAAKICRSRRRSRSGGCSDSRSCRSCRRCMRFRAEQFGVGAGPRNPLGHGGRRASARHAESDRPRPLRRRSSSSGSWAATRRSSSGLADRWPTRVGRST